MTTFTESDKLDAITRELGFRRRVYARQVEAGRMTAAKAEREIALMEAIRDDYRERAEKERLL